MKLKPYTGPHSAGLYYVVDDQDRVIRNASVLEVKLWEERETLISLLSQARNCVDYQMSAQRYGTGHKERFAELLQQVDAALNKAKVNS